MRLALAEAEHAPLTGDVPVGAVVLAPDGTVLARAHNEREATGDPTAHAEILAIRRAAAALRALPRPASESRPPARSAGAPRDGEWRLTGCTLAVTLEPCTMCAGAIVLARLDRVVYGAPDPKAGAAGSLWDLVRDRRLNHRPEVVAGVLPTSSAALLTRFFRPNDF
ncbi:nucleoside deaminase [Streptomyces sp.]|uniref:nucleoside deaminase n=1 Tax=Streptomyces sp. TaxID=1931 RepID=UPI002F416AC5